LKNRQSPIRVVKLTLAGLFIALGVIIPFFAGHAVGIPGTILLPMHIPVLMAGLLLGWPYGLVVGLLAPVLSSFLTGMPPMWPMLPLMICELMAYGFFTGLLRKKAKLPLYVSLPAAMVVGRLVGAVVLVFVGMAQPNITSIATVATGILLTGLPGIAIQLAFIPLLVDLVEKAFVKTGIQLERAAPAQTQTDKGFEALREKNMLEENQDAIDRAIRAIESGVCGCVLIKHNTIIYQGRGKGVAPLLELVGSEEGCQKLKGALVVDRIIGKAAAMLLVLGKGKYAYGLTMSKSGADYLQAHDVEIKSHRCVDVISDRTGRGICPMERSVMEIDDPGMGYQKIQETLEKLRSQVS